MKITTKMAVLMSLFMPLAAMATVALPSGFYNFDEIGNWSWSGGGSGQVTQQIPGGGVQYDLSSLPYSLPLTYVQNQTFGFFEAGTSFDLDNLSDVIHFDDAYHFSYYSDPGDSALADLTSGSLQEFITANGWTLQSTSFEIGTEDNNHLTFIVSLNGGAYVSFTGISDVPEPSMWSLLPGGALLAGFRLLWRRRWSWPKS